MCHDFYQRYYHINIRVMAYTIFCVEGAARSICTLCECPLTVKQGWWHSCSGQYIRFYQQPFWKYANVFHVWIIQLWYRDCWTLRNMAHPFWDTLPFLFQNKGQDHCYGHSHKTKFVNSLFSSMWLNIYDSPDWKSSI